MDIFDKLYLVLIAAQFIAAFAFLLWQHMLMPKNIEKKYSFLVRLQLAIPFPSNWERKVERSDLAVFRNYRKVALAFDGFLAFTFGLQFLVWLWRSTNF